MKFVFSLAMKNLTRYKRRTLITAVAIAAGLSIFIWMDAFMLGVEKESERNMVLYETGSAQILTSAFFEEIQYLPLKEAFDDPDKVVAALEEHGYKATKRINFSGELFYEEGSRQARIYAIDMKTYSRVVHVEDTLLNDEKTTSRMPVPGRNEIILGKKIAEKLKIDINKQLMIRTRTRGGTYQVGVFTLVGIVDSPNPKINMERGFIPLEDADQLLLMQGGVTEVAFAVEEWKNLDKELAKIESTVLPAFPGLVAKDWNDVTGNIMYMNQKKNIAYSMLALVFIIAAVGISNTMLMAIYERMREIGMMRAMGMDDRDIQRAFLFEAAGIGFIGSLMGVLLGAGLTLFSVEWGLDYSAFIGDMDLGYRISGVMKAAWKPISMVVAFFSGILISMLVSFIPSSRALKMDITDCLRHQ